MLKAAFFTTVAWLPAIAFSQDRSGPESLEEKVVRLEAELAQARAELAAREAMPELEAEAEGSDFPPETSKQADVPAPIEQKDEERAGFYLGDLRIGGAIRANFVLGDYTHNGTTAPQRGGHGGNFELDTFRINLDYDRGEPGFLAKAEYRWYDGYNFAHTAWLGWRFEDDSVLQAGLNRVPFGAGPYGTSHNWFFDLGYYVGLTDDMDLGLNYRKEAGDWTLDLAYYAAAEPNFRGATADSARYSYDIVDNGSPNSHYRERHQVNLRAIRHFSFGEDRSFDAGASFQAGLLEADPRFANDSHQLAAAVHGTYQRGPWEVVAQLTGYDYAADYRPGTGLSNDLIGMGAYDFEFPVASRGLLPAVGIAYTWEPENNDWFDSITFYDDFSILLKDGCDNAGVSLNDSAMNVLGMAIARGGWYVYVDWAYSNGNYFIGNESFTNFGANRGQRWQSRFNINFGYYF
ncbi:hypothetical protein [Haloferula sargassicola]|uniref:Phosphate-selective porin O and P n=1 Tax=Haloferula sargassicola TaxID=490096 RepID=A0ABP9UK60_9BACT